MDASYLSTNLSFLRGDSSLGDRVEHRLALTAEDKELVYRTRYTAFFRQNLVPLRSDRRLFDENYDDAPNNHEIMTFFDDEFVSTFRIHVGVSEGAILPSLDDFGDVVTPFLREGRVVMDLTRIVAKLECARKVPEMPLLTFRAAWLAAEHFGVDVIILPCMGDHRAFYERMFGFEALGSPRAFPLIAGTISCMALDYTSKKERVENRFPLFRSTEAERRSIFADSRPADGRAVSRTKARSRKRSFAA